MGNWHLVSAYQKPGRDQEQQEAWCQSIGADLAKLGNSKWIMAGDYNHDPREDIYQIFAASMQSRIVYPHSEEADDPDTEYPIPTPTRWEGQRWAEGLYGNQ